MKNTLLCFLILVLYGCAGGASGGAFSVPTLPSKSESQSANVGESNSVFVGYDDSGSTAISQLLKYQINNEIYVDPDLAQPYEILNAEKFESENMVAIGDFKISVGLLQSESKEAGKVLYDLGVHLQAPTITREERPDFVITYCIDVSGSMSESTGASDLSVKSKMTLVKEGLIASINMLNDGDVVNIVTFSDKFKTLVENYIHGESDVEALLTKINAMKASGSTNLEGGLKLAYQIANKYHVSEKKSRVLLATDAIVNGGSADPKFIADNIVVNNKNGILLCGVGIGFDYDASFLEKLTEASSGNQFLLATDADAEYIFSDGLFPLLMVAAKNLKVEIVYPVTLTHISSAAEQVTTTASELKGINFSNNSDQYYLERFKTEIDTVVTNKEFEIQLTYTDPTSNELISVSKTFVIDSILSNESSNIKDALAMIYLTSLIKGNKNWDDMKWEFEHVFSGHHSYIYAEFKSLIYKFAGQKDEDEF
jgi:Mg-chelatase subunit ChlD